MSDALNKVFAKFSSPSSYLPTWAQRAVKATHPIHVLAILSLLLFSHTVDLIPGHLRIMRRLEARKSHQLS